MAASDWNDIRQRMGIQGAGGEPAPSAEPWARAEQEEEEAQRERRRSEDEPGPAYNFGEDSGALPTGYDRDGER